MAGTGPLRLGAKGAGAKAVCVFVHGRGQSPEEMQSHVLARLAVPHMAFVLPRAPSGAWYTAKAVDPLTTQTRAELCDALDIVGSAMIGARAELPGRPLLLAGFSQGACLSLEYCFSGQPQPDALAAFTGCRVGDAADRRSSALQKGLPVYLSGSDADPWIPVTAFADAALALGQCGAALRTDLWPGRPHEVSDGEIAMMQSICDELTSGKQITMAAARQKYGTA